MSAAKKWGCHGSQTTIVRGSASCRCWLPGICRRSTAGVTSCFSSRCLRRGGVRRGSGNFPLRTSSRHLDIVESLCIWIPHCCPKHTRVTDDKVWTWFADNLPSFRDRGRCIRCRHFNKEKKQKAWRADLDGIFLLGSIQTWSNARLYSVTFCQLCSSRL